jgi:hypothetical protein
MSMFNWKDPVGDLTIMRRRVGKLEDICHIYPVNEIGQIVGNVSIKKRLFEIEHKLDMLINHIGLEEYKPNCDVKFRAKELEK